MELCKYPRPATDTGWGFHDSAGCHNRPLDLRGYARYLRRELGITWFKALVAGVNKVDLAEVFTREGIEVIVRLYSQQPHPLYVVSVADVRAYVDAGVHYVEWDNEPNLVVEWNRVAWDEGARVDKVCEQFLRNADAIRQGGGIPLLPALSPGGDYPHREWYRTTFDWLRLHGHLADLEGAGLAIHNRPLNRPLSFNDAASGCFFLDYEWIDDLAREYLGHSLPLLATEAGCEPGWAQDAGFPAITLPTHAQLNVEILRGFRERRWRDALFCQCLWLVDSFGHGDFAEAAWHNNQRWADGGNLPAVDALRREWAAQPFTRCYAWEPAPVLSPQSTYPCSDRVGMPVTALVWHGAEGHRVSDYLATQTRKSAHYAIECDGVVTSMVPERMAAWHCGGSSIPGVPAWVVGMLGDPANLASIGIELACNPAPARPGWTDTELAAAIRLGREITSRYKLRRDQHYRHSDITRLKGDPREFPWQWFLDAMYESVLPPTKEEKVAKAIREIAWRGLGLSWNPDHAFPRIARERDLGAPMDPEVDVTVDGIAYRYQPYAGGIVFAQVGHWDDCEVIKW